ncbi:hypothetical protein GCM10022214_00370 [Actinomadura miaoliensis]|uniref:GntR family transcriptional regulator n=1 Tax=Actinomadura miaoliensis TaxID=430685 RepID=A0ABP7UVD3_9ACTN
MSARSLYPTLIAASAISPDRSESPRRAVQRIVTELESAGYLARTRTGRRTAMPST